jgi:hypothetical protein
MKQPRKGTIIAGVSAYLQTGKAITALEAQATFNTMRLASAIEELRNKYGMDIRTDIKVNPGTGKEYASYTLRPSFKVRDRVQLKSLDASIKEGLFFGTPASIKTEYDGVYVGNYGRVVSVDADAVRVQFKNGSVVVRAEGRPRDLRGRVMARVTTMRAAFEAAKSPSASAKSRVPSVAARQPRALLRRTRLLFHPGCGYKCPPTVKRANQPRGNTSVRTDRWRSRSRCRSAASRRDLRQVRLHRRARSPTAPRCRSRPYYKDGKLVAQHYRTATKDFGWIGESKDVELFGQHLWRDGGKMVVVTEGEIDAMTVSQLQDNKWPVVSIPNGAQSAKKSIANNIEWLNRFETVVLMFDMDEPGRRAAVEECAQLFPPGKCKVASLPLKDANEMLLEGRGRRGDPDAIWGAKEFRPDGIVTLDRAQGRPDREIENGCRGASRRSRADARARLGEVYGFGAGTGVGKTDVLTQQISSTSSS